MSIPINLSEALQAQNATFIGGGTDIMPLLKNHVRDDKNFVFVGKLPELQGIEEADGFLRVGAGTTLFDVSENQLIRSRYPALAQAAAATASPQIRNIATIGGNILQDRRCIYFNQS
ncbi:MAG: FAD binding domain-containing protein, partial [Oscillospiraceae bacterium]|nr:FAD binding domain-containing protein [Oscillospiraceae bacterium]